MIIPSASILVYSIGSHVFRRFNVRFEPEMIILNLVVGFPDKAFSYTILLFDKVFFEKSFQILYILGHQT